MRQNPTRKIPDRVDDRILLYSSCPCARPTPNGVCGNEAGAPRGMLGAEQAELFLNANKIPAILVFTQAAGFDVSWFAFQKLKTTSLLYVARGAEPHALLRKRGSQTLPGTEGCRPNTEEQRREDRAV